MKIYKKDRVDLPLDESETFKVFNNSEKGGEEDETLVTSTSKLVDLASITFKNMVSTSENMKSIPNMEEKVWR